MLLRSVVARADSVMDVSVSGCLVVEFDREIEVYADFEGDVVFAYSSYSRVSFLGTLLLQASALVPRLCKTLCS